MKTGKWFGRFLIGFVVVLSAACGGGGSGSTGIGPGGGDSLDDRLPNKGLQGTLYFKSGKNLSSLDLTDPEMGYLNPKIDGLEQYDAYFASVSKDGDEYALQFVGFAGAGADFSWYTGIGIFRIDGPLVNSFSVDAKPYGFPKLSPDNQLLALGFKPYGGFKYENITPGLRIFDRNGLLIREFLSSDSDIFLSDWAWTRDGRLVISYEKQGLYIVDAIRSGQPRLLRSFEGKTALYLDVSPDDSKIAFAFHEKEQAFVMNIDGTELRQLTVSNEPAVDNSVIRALSWSPDGQNIAIVAESPLESLPCTSELLIVKSGAIEAPLPIIKPYHDGKYPVQSDDLFYVQEYKYEFSRDTFKDGSFCVKGGDIAWRE
jgi:hypothetical protein